MIDNNSRGLDMELNTKYGTIKIFTDNVGEKAIGQIIQVANSPLGDGAHIRIMPDCHEGAGCVIGTTMLINGKVCPNLVGVDIGCGVMLARTDIDFASRLKELDDVIRRKVPFGSGVHKSVVKFDFEQLKCWAKLPKQAKMLAEVSLGTLGGGNHFIEAYDNGCIAVHSGSRNIGLSVANYYQRLAVQHVKGINKELRTEKMQEIEPKDRERWIYEYNASTNLELSYLEGDEMRDYLHDVGVMQTFADENRRRIIDQIVSGMSGKVLSSINTIHNYIDLDGMILRKGSISAKKGEMVVIPLNMRDGMLICCGKGNEDWNYSAPHGAGRLYSRSRAKELFTVEEYAAAMEGIFSTCIGMGTLDEAPFAYKDGQEIMQAIAPTVDILEVIKPIYNFKAS